MRLGHDQGSSTNFHGGPVDGPSGAVVNTSTCRGILVAMVGVRSCTGRCLKAGRCQRCAQRNGRPSGVWKLAPRRLLRFCVCSPCRADVGLWFIASCRGRGRGCNGRCSRWAAATGEDPFSRRAAAVVRCVQTLACVGVGGVDEMRDSCVVCVSRFAYGSALPRAIAEQNKSKTEKKTKSSFSVLALLHDPRAFGEVGGEIAPPPQKIIRLSFLGFAA